MGKVFTMRTAKFQLKELLGIGFTVVILGIGLAYGMDVMQDARGDLIDADVVGCNTTSNVYWNCSNSAAVNATSDSMTGTLNLTTKLPTIMTVVVASVIIGILVTYLWARFSQ